MKKILFAMFLTTVSLPLWSVETSVGAKAPAVLKKMPAIVYSSEGRLKPESYKDEAKARKLLRERDAKVNEIIAERRRLFTENQDIKEVWNNVSVKYRRVAAYLKQINATGDPLVALKEHPKMLALYRDAQKGLSQITLKIETRQSMLTLLDQLADIDFEIDRLELIRPVSSDQSKNIQTTTPGSK